MKTRLKKRLGRWAGALIVASCSYALGQPAATAAATADGAAIFQNSCSGCHGANGGGTALGKSLKVRDLRSSEVQAMSSVALSSVIGEGKGKMPAFGEKLSKADIAKLVAYVRTLGKL